MSEYSILEKRKGYYVRRPPLLTSRHKISPPPMAHGLHVFRFMIMFSSPFHKVVGFLQHKVFLFVKT